MSSIFGDNQRYIFNLLIRKNLLSDEQKKLIEESSKQKKMELADTILELKILTEDKILKELSSDLAMDYIHLSQIKIDPKAVELITYEQAKQFDIMPVKIDVNGNLIVATHQPLDLVRLDNLRIILKTSIDMVVAESADIIRTRKAMYEESFDDDERKEKENSSFASNYQLGYVDAEEKNITAEDAPIIRMVTSIILEAFRLRASDIHLEPSEKFFRIRYRIDGVLVEIKKHPRQLQPPVTSRIKLLADMKLSEKRLPQDGKIKITVQNTPIDIRVSSLPGIYGESVVMRLLDKKELSLGLVTLGFLSDTEKTWNKLISLSNGVILITGPTGSGKTTTLYSCLHALNIPGRKIITVEDPVEYQLAGINQVQVREEINLTFSSVLRACLRQAPNIIMVGEIRDSETAKIAMNAAFTGHLVFSTLHTNDSAGAITRLIDQKVEPFLVASAVRGILAQRLVRKICAKCEISYEAREDELLVLGLPKKTKQIIKKGVGCSFCGGTGYKGRLGIFELLVITPQIQDMIYKKNSSSEIKDYAVKNGMRTLKDDAVLKVLNGTTTVQELMRVTKIGET